MRGRVRVTAGARRRVRGAYMATRSAHAMDEAPHSLASTPAASARGRRTCSDESRSRSVMLSLGKAPPSPLPGAG